MSTPPTTPIADDATPPTWVTLPPSIEPEQEACYVDEFGVGTSQYHFVACDAATWPGPVIPRTVTEVTTAVAVPTPSPTTQLPETGSEGTVAFIATAALLLGILFTRIARS